MVSHSTPFPGSESFQPAFSNGSESAIILPIAQNTSSSMACISISPVGRAVNRSGSSGLTWFILNLSSLIASNTLGSSMSPSTRMTPGSPSELNRSLMRRTDWAISASSSRKSSTLKSPSRSNIIGVAIAVRMSVMRIMLQDRRNATREYSM